MSHNRISQISVGDPPVPLEIRVLKKWTSLFGEHERKQDICYLFVDIDGNAIEATTAKAKEAHFDSIIELQSCYTVDKYVAIPSRSFMPVVQHHASLRLGSMATFTQISGKNIPAFYYCFASYSDLQPRLALPRLLTDYIARIESVGPIEFHKGKRVRKVIIQDERRNVMEIALWGDKADEIEKDGTVGKLLPLKNLGEPSQQLTTTTQVTLAELNAKSSSERQQNRYMCVATIVELHKNKNWFYVNCSECPNKVYQQQGAYVCEDHGILAEPKFMYCINATIQDDTATSEALFFNEAANDVLNISCRDMVIKHGNTNPKTLSPQLHNIIGIQRQLHVSVKKDGPIVVNKADSTDALPPCTPDLKGASTKRLLQNPTVMESCSKLPKH